MLATSAGENGIRSPEKVKPGKAGLPSPGIMFCALCALGTSVVRQLKRTPFEKGLCQLVLLGNGVRLEVNL